MDNKLNHSLNSQDLPLTTKKPLTRDSVTETDNQGEVKQENDVLVA